MIILRITVAHCSQLEAKAQPRRSVPPSPPPPPPAPAPPPAAAASSSPELPTTKAGSDARRRSKLVKIRREEREKLFPPESGPENGPKLGCGSERVPGWGWAG